MTTQANPLALAKESPIHLKCTLRPVPTPPSTSSEGMTGPSKPTPVPPSQMVLGGQTGVFHLGLLAYLQLRQPPPWVRTAEETEIIGSYMAH